MSNETPDGLRGSSGRKRPGWLFRVLVPLGIFLIVYVPIDLGVGHLKSRRRQTIQATVASDVVRVPSEVFHHGLRPLTEQNDPWGSIRYPLCTNSLGFKDASKRVVSPRPSGRRIVFIGDSFTEGIGLEHERTFVGRIGSLLADRGVEVLNAGTVSYSPKLMFLKLDDLLRVQGVRFDELAMFVDCSDAIDEVEYGWFRHADLQSRGLVPPGIDFREVGRGDDRWYECSLLYREIMRRFGGGDPWKKAVTFENAVTGRRFVHFGERCEWAFRRDLQDAWATEGLASAAFYADRILDLGREFGFRVSIAIYPWPAELRAGVSGSRNVEFWRGYCAARGIALFDLYPAFADRGEAARVIDDLFIAGDCHWNEAGHRLVADTWLSQRTRANSLQEIPAAGGPG